MRLLIWSVVLAFFSMEGNRAHAEDPTGPRAGFLAPRRSAPQIKFAEPLFDFGIIAPGAVEKHEYIFTNTGTAPLILTGVRSSCGCTTIGTWSVKVEAGQTGTVPISFNSKGFDGAINKWIAVASNDTDHPEVLLALKGTIRSPIEVSPPAAIFTSVTDSRGRETKIIRITNNTREPLILSTPKSTNSAFAVEIKTVRSGQEFELHITAMPQAGAVTTRGFITIKTNLTQFPVITVTVVTVARKPATA